MKIYLVDGHIIFREGLASMLESQPDFRIVGRAGSMAQALEELAEANPDIVLMDINLPDVKNMDAIQTILSENPDTNVVILTNHDSDQLLFDAIRFGAKGYIPKRIQKREFMASMGALQRGETAFTAEMTRRILNEFTRMGKTRSPEEGSKPENCSHTAGCQA